MNKKTYSEEEVKNLSKEAYYRGRNDELDEKETHKKMFPEEEFELWFNQKKK